MQIFDEMLGYSKVCDIAQVIHCRSIRNKFTSKESGTLSRKLR